MRSFKTSWTVCVQNFRKWSGDTRVIIAFVLLLIVNHYYGSFFLDYNQSISGNGVAPWNLIHLFQDGRIKAMLILPLVFLFSDAPFIDVNQPYVISRCSRKSWSFGQVLYIILGSGAYLLASFVMSILVIIGNIEWTTDWGLLIRTAVKEGANIPGVNMSTPHYFTPFIALFYTVLLSWMACSFIGLVIYVVNSATGKMGYGIAAGSLFVLLDFACVTMFAANPLKNQWVYYFSPITWCSISLINLEKDMSSPNITFVLCTYSVLIIALSVIAVMISRKQQIDVIQAV